MKRNSIGIIGASLIILGAGMFVSGISIFAYQGSNLSPLISEIGKYFFLYWLPVLVVGLILLAFRQKKNT
jgi:hypothetical protein